MVTTQQDKGDVCRIGMMSRIDFGSDGFRLGYVELAKGDFQKEDVHFVILAGGLISARDVRKQETRLKREERVLKKQAKELTKRQTGLEKLEEPNEKALAEVQKTVDTATEELERVQKRLASYRPEGMAARLAKLLPTFVNAKGEAVKLHIIVSPVYDGEIGEETAQLLPSLRPDIRVYKPGSDEFPVKQAKKRLEVLTPTVSPWRGDHASTGVQRVLKDASNIRTARSPDVQVAGCFGVTLTKPEGANRTPWLSLPVLHKLQGVRVSESQIGVRVVEIWENQIDPVVRTYAYKDYVGQELTYIEAPAKASSNQLRVISALRKGGEMPISELAQKSGLTRDAAERAARSLIREGGRVLKSWPGLLFYEDSKRWDFNKRWLQTKLRYPPVVGEVMVESIVADGCLHAGSVQTDYKHFIEEVPRVMLETSATVLVHAGDLIEGLKHDLVLRGEVFGGLNCTMQERLAGEMIAKVTIKVFKKRFLRAFAKLLAGKPAGQHPTRDELATIIIESLPKNVLIPGNHDEWVIGYGSEPLVTLAYTAADRITAAIEDMLLEKDLCFGKLREIVQGKIVVLPNFGRFTLPSGVRCSVQHPHMGNAQTESLRLQGMLRVAGSHKSTPGCQVVIGANFHTGIHMEVYDPSLGQRVGLQLGTGKHGTDFEIRKLKIVDHGFAHLKITSVREKGAPLHTTRVVASEVAFYSNDPAKADLLDPKDIYKDVLRKYELGA